MILLLSFTLLSNHLVASFSPTSFTFGMRYSYSQLNGITKPQDAEGVIFDIDGTLANSWKLGFDATQVVLKNRNIPLITEELYHECTRYSTPDRLARHAGYIPGDKGFDEIGKALAAEFDDLYVGLVDKSTAGFYPGIDELILDLPISEVNDDEKRGVKIAALTNACVAYAHAVLKTNCDGREIYSRFLSIHGADTVPQPKPKPDGLLICCQEIDISPERCVYIGDSPTDGLAAKAAGMISIGCSWGSHSEDSLRQNGSFDYICSSVSGLKDLLPK
jgi:phosphoglycolate phosphatase-like HAD superfamily hydrolase